MFSDVETEFVVAEVEGTKFVVDERAGEEEGVGECWLYAEMDIAVDGNVFGLWLGRKYTPCLGTLDDREIAFKPKFGW